ncbi:hypothetical protein RDWZM_001891 [Blomia tropicalis]|uniref:Complex I assembly factor TIMMDC1, mitochondrial n=1 Tax=Blomia tropicalis TaxID=40697 RepID=A0A9Q0RRQ4_BLOTA|nr:Complex I assembly factor timmdc1, mitochondrial [Blomia tropicalis]KAJ6223346.1 hypothetical protein RDWZM_001891 [Blomia tropicalis]
MTSTPPSTDGQSTFQSNFPKPTFWESWRNWFEPNTEALELAKSMQNDPNETGIDRLKQTWISYLNGEDTIELHIVTNAASMAGMFGFVFGGLLDSRATFNEYIRRYNTNIYQGQFKANRTLADTMYIQFFKRGIKSGTKYFLFTGLFVGTLSASITYHNDVHFIDCGLCGAFSGMAWRGYLGPRAALVNGITGFIFGTTFAGIMKLIMKTSNTSIQEMRFYRRAIKDSLPDYD